MERRKKQGTTEIDGGCLSLMCPTGDPDLLEKAYREGKSVKFLILRAHLGSYGLVRALCQAYGTSCSGVGCPCGDGAPEITLKRIFEANTRGVSKPVYKGVAVMIGDKPRR